jgi:hypothetical protein
MLDAMEEDAILASEQYKAQQAAVSASRAELEKELRRELGQKLRSEIEAELQVAYAKQAEETRAALEKTLRSSVEQDLRPRLVRELENKIESDTRRRLEKEIRAALENELKGESEQQRAHLEKELRKQFEQRLRADLEKHESATSEQALRKRLVEDTPQADSPSILRSPAKVHPIAEPALKAKTSPPALPLEAVRNVAPSAPVLTVAKESVPLAAARQAPAPAPLPAMVKTATPSPSPPETLTRALPAPAAQAPPPVSPSVIDLPAGHSAREKTGKTREEVQPEGHAAVQTVTDPHERAKRRARVIVSDLSLYDKATLVKASQATDSKKVLGLLWREAVRSYDQAVPPSIRASTKYLEEELGKYLAQLRQA